MKFVFLEHKPRLGTKAYVIITRSVGFGQMDFCQQQKVFYVAPFQSIANECANVANES